MAPLTSEHLAVRELANVLLIGGSKGVSALSVFLSTAPVARVQIVVEVGHNTLAMAFIINPVAVVLSHARIRLFTDAGLEILRPCAFVNTIVTSVLSSHVVGIFAITMSQLFKKTVT